MGQLSTFLVDTFSPGIVNYVWDYGDGTTGAGFVGMNTYNNTGLYAVSLVITDANLCSDTVFGIGQVNPLPSANATVNPAETTILNPIVAITDSSDAPAPANISTWTWDFGDGVIIGPDSGTLVGFPNTSGTLQNPIHTYSDTGVYSIGLTVVNEFGCLSSDVISLKIKPIFIFHTPNSFTPNGDGINDLFPLGIDGRLPGIGLEAGFEMYIYNRWGDLIFETKSIFEAWDGTVNRGSTPAQEDVYVWKVNAVDSDKKRHQFVGHVTLIR